MLRFEHVSLSYGSQKIIDDISFEIQEGQMAVLIGSSGCGKTTTLKMINRLIEPTSGKIYINGKDIAAQDRVELRRHIGYVIQQIGLFPNMTVAQNICVVPNLLKYSKEACDKIVHELLELVNLPYEQYAHKYPSEMSGGQQQRIGILRALALLGIIMVTPLGAGKPTVILGLALYSLLPIVRNVTLGLSQVSPAVKEAAKGMGMTRVYSLFHVELPLAMPMLFTGLRIAVVNAIGTAVFASSVGGGGLGNLINTGIRRNDVAMILSGTAALMAMALLLDNLMAFCERRMGRRDSSSRPGRHAVLRRRLTAGAAAVLVAVLCLPSLLPKDTSSTLVLYDGEFSAVQLVNRMVQQLVEDRTGLEVSILDPMTSINNFKELTAREPSCDLMYTWDGTILTTFLGLDTSDIPAGQSLYDFVNGRIGEQYGARMLGKIGVDNTYSIGVTQAVMDTYHPAAVSDLAPIAGELRFGAEQDFYTDAGSMKYGPFVAFYGLQFQEAIQVDIMLKYTAIKSGSYDVMVVYATDGLNKDANLTILEDDKSFFPEYNGVLTVRDGLFEDFADRAPELEQTLELLTGQFTNEVMSELTYRVDVLGEDVDLVAADYLHTLGLL